MSFTPIIQTPLRHQGLSLLTAIMALLILSVLGLGIVSTVSIESQISLNVATMSQALYLAEAGIERGIRSVRDDTAAPAQTVNPLANGYHAEPSIDAFSAAGNAINTSGAMTYGGTNCRIQSLYFFFIPFFRYVNVYNFNQMVNLLGTSIDRVEIGCRFRRINGRGTLRIQYTVDNWSTTGTTYANWNARNWTVKYLDITPDRSWNWNILNSSNFKIRAAAIPRFGGFTSVTYDVDYLFLRIRYEIDASTEPWYSDWRNMDDTGSPKTVNLLLGNGSITSLPVYDEAAKININYANQGLLQSLFEKCGIPGSDAIALSSGIISYRSTNWFDSIEETKQVSAVTDSYYDMIKDYITVYSWVNTSVQRPSGSRAPVNINTAPRQVLEAIFDPVAGISSSDATQLAQDIISQRGTAPFTCMYSSDPDIITDFSGFVDSRSYLSSAEKNAVKENADASATNWDGSSVVTTEFCYYSKVFSITATGKVRNVSRIVKRVFQQDGSFTITTNWGPTLNFWRELSP